MKISSLILSSSDYYLVPIYLIIIYVVALIIQSNNIQKFPEFKYFIQGLSFKLMGVSAFMIIYLFYYKGGDTINYFISTKAIGNLISQNFDRGWHIVFNTSSPLNDFSSFNGSTGLPMKYMWKDPSTFAVARFTTPLYFIGSGSFIITSFLTSIISFIGVWKFYRLFNLLYPGNERALAYLILFLPTLVFWGGGIMKDSYVLGATCWITFNFYRIFIERKKIILNSIFLIINLFIIINIKSYVIISLLPGMLLWLNSAYLKGINNSFSRFLLFPFFIIIISFLGFFILNNLSSLMGVYGNVDTAIQQAQVIQDDLLREDQYGQNNYNIGEIDGSVSGLISIAPIAIFTALFRPLFWEIGSPTMFISAFENLILLVFVFILIIRVSPFKILTCLLSEPFLTYCFTFSIIFAFGVGIAGTNFGALVRYKVPLIPFFFSMIFIIFKLTRSKSI